MRIVADLHPNEVARLARYAVSMTPDQWENFVTIQMHLGRDYPLIRAALALYVMPPTLAERRTELDEKMGDAVKSLKSWVDAQFADWYTPSQRAIDSFTYGFILAMMDDHGMTFDVTYEELINDWNIEESFNDTFQD